jgi:hypothetical protein
VNPLVSTAAAFTNCEVAGAEITFADTTIESDASSAAAKFRVTDVVARTPARAGLDAPTDTDEAVRAVGAADAGATDDNVPKPKAATATSAMRLKVVFVDICFLSISRVREFPALGFG